MDDVDAVQAQIARNMLASNDWVTARLDGVAYLEKAPLIYWMMAVSYKIFGVHDWAARLPLALAAVVLCWLTYRFGRWAFGEEAGLYAGVILATSAGLFLFTRILDPGCHTHGDYHRRHLGMAVTARTGRASSASLVGHAGSVPGNRAIAEGPDCGGFSGAGGHCLHGSHATTFSLSSRGVD